MKQDRIGPKYYSPLITASSLSDWAFYVAAALSIAALLVDRAAHPDIYNLVQILFGLAVLAVFVAGLATRVYWSPRAEDKRRQDLISYSFNIALTHEASEGYYNNDQQDPWKKLGAALLENSLFSKSIALKMLPWERTRIAIYIVLWLIALANRSTDLGLVAVVAQAVFSEQILSRWFRLEWLRMRYERVYESLYQLFQATTQFSSDEFRSRVIEAFGLYETGKAYGGVNMSTRVFNQLNPSLSEEWNTLRKLLKL